jgi:hypothetical protein
MSAKKQLSIKLWFLIFYSFNLVGSLSNGWENTSNSWDPNFTVVDHAAGLFREIFSIAGFIDILLFPALAASIAMTFSVYSYRHFKTKLKTTSGKYFLALLIFVGLILSWIVISIILALILN